MVKWDLLHPLWTEWQTDTSENITLIEKAPLCQQNVPLIMLR